MIQRIFFKCLNRTPQTKRNTCVAVYLYGKLSRAEFYNYVNRQKNRRKNYVICSTFSLYFSFAQWIF